MSGTKDSAADFTRLSQNISTNVQKVQQNVSSITRMVDQLGTSQETEMLWDKLNQIQHYTNQLVKDINKNLKELSSMTPLSSHSDQRVRKLQVERLTKDFSDSLNSFQMAQRRVAEKEKQSVARARAQSSNKDSMLDDSLGTTQLVNFASPTPQVQAQMEDVDLELLEERENAIRQLESDIQDVNSIFKDLGLMVHEQGEMVDSIEANVETAAVQVEEGTAKLRKASEYQTKSRKKKCIILIVVLILLGVVALIIWLSVK